MKWSKNQNAFFNGFLLRSWHLLFNIFSSVLLFISLSITWITIKLGLPCNNSFVLCDWSCTYFIGIVLSPQVTVLHELLMIIPNSVILSKPKIILYLQYGDFRFVSTYVRKVMIEF